MIERAVSNPFKEIIMVDYVYRNKPDTKRVKIFKVCDDDNNKLFYWDVDIWDGPNSVRTYSECGDCFRTKKEAKIYAVEECGELVSLGNIEMVTDGMK